MKRIQFYTTGSFLLMTLSAAAETWFAGVSDHNSIFLPGYDLLKILFPGAVLKLSNLGSEYFPVLWGFLTSTVFHLPLWSIFAFASIGFSYLLMTDPTEIKRYGKNFENLELWAAASFQDDGATAKNNALQAVDAERQDKKTAYVDPDVWCPLPSPEDQLKQCRWEELPNEYKISEVVPGDMESFSEKNNLYSPRQFNESLKSAHVDPDIWMPIISSEDEQPFINREQGLPKDEIYEFDEFCEFLNYTEARSDDENSDEEQLLRLLETKQ